MGGPVPRPHDPTGLCKGRSYAETLRAWRELHLSRAVRRSSKPQ